MAKRILIIALFVLFSGQLFAENNSRHLKVQRTDVDSIRAGFITATKKFGINVIAENTMNCNGVSFELEYNQSNYIKFSGYEVRDLKNVSVNHYEMGGDMGTVIVGAGSGDKPWERAIDEPIAVYLEFVVAPSAPDYVVSELYAEFNFLQPGADIITDTGTVTIQFPKKKVNYKIHGYVNVHPGDADNNGIVDSRDYLVVYRHNGTGALTKNFRSFKRETPSVQWYSQPALRWDSAMVTFADCDGNGDITMADELIVSANMHKTHSQGTTSILPTQPIRGMCDAKGIAKEGDTRIPIKVTSDKEFIAFCGKVKLNETYGKIKGIEAGDFFGENPVILSKVSNEEKSAEFLISHNGNRILETEGIAGYLVIEGEYSNLPEISLDGLQAINNNGSIFPIEQLIMNSVEDEDEQSIMLANGQLKIENMEYGNELTIFDYTGQKIIRREINGSANISLENYSNGVYFITLQKKDSIIRKKILLIH